jgi:hypothetical protein
VTERENYDSLVAMALDALLPRKEDRGDWARVLADANRSRGSRLVRSGLLTRRTRIALAAAALFLAAAIPITALAVSRGWWFFRASAPTPTSSVVVVDSGTWQGTPWELTAYTTTGDGLCVAFTPNPPAGPPITPPAAGSSRATEMMGCGAPVRGIPGLPAGTPRHELGFISSASDTATGTAFAAVAGPAAASVAKVEIVPANGRPILIDTLPTPAKLGVDVRFYVAVLRAGQELTRLIALDNAGRPLETITLRRAPSPTTPTSTLPSNSYNYSWGS